MKVSLRSRQGDQAHHEGQPGNSVGVRQVPYCHDQAQNGGKECADPQTDGCIRLYQLQPPGALTHLVIGKAEALYVSIDRRDSNVEFFGLSVGY